LAGIQPMFLDLPRNQVFLSDPQLLCFGVTGQSDGLHPVAKGSGNSLNVICGTDKNDLAQVKRYVEVSIEKGIVLPRVQDSEQSAGRIPPHIGSNFIHLIQHEHRIANAKSPYFLNNTARHRTDIGSSMASNFGLVANSAERNARKFPSQG